MRKNVLTIIFAILFLYCQNIFAWGDLGHQTVAEIAQRRLSPKAKLMISDILGHGPLAEAATFPDLVRSDKDFNKFAAFHFIEIDHQGPSYDLDKNKPKHDANAIIANVPLKLFSMEKSGKNKYNKN